MSDNGPKNLRDHAAELKRQLDAANAEVESLRGQVASQALSRALTGKGYSNPGKVGRDLVADGVDPLDKGAVQEWLSEHGGDYAKVAGPQVSAAVQAGYSQLSSLGEYTRHPTDLSKLDIAKSEITKDMSPDEVYQTLTRHGL